VALLARYEESGESAQGRTPAFTRAACPRRRATL